MSLRDVTSVRQSVRAALSRHERIVLAVSGGLDSMVLLDAAAGSVPRERLIVATFDHGTGNAASSARALVEEQAALRAVTCVADRATSALSGEAALRDARWTFLRRVAGEHDAVVCTAHTEDDQIETVLMRILRDAGPRGLAALYAESPVVRPFLRVTRRQLVAYARMRGLVWLEDPSNATPAYLRNRVRHDLLPALRHVRSSIESDLLSLARKAARWRADVEGAVNAIDGLRVLANGRGVDVPDFVFGRQPQGASVVLWPAIAARAGLVLDRRAIERLAAFTANGRVGARIPLSGGWEVVRSRDAFQLRPRLAGAPTSQAVALSESVTWGDWLFTSSGAMVHMDGDPWTASLPADLPLSVRSWQAGDAMICREGGSPRKVKRLLSDAGVTGHQRTGWPVVLAGDQIVWIPGVRRTDAATARSGRPGLPFQCEYIHR